MAERHRFALQKPPSSVRRSQASQSTVAFRRRQVRFCTEKRKNGTLNPLSRRRAADTLKECLDGNAIILQAKTAFFPAA
ncbi:MAG: hypothetical protein E7590_03320 [Ruminococcaceae bacterium]|nr:hypothetical protein [Oscillospiraceae bacterium]